MCVLQMYQLGAEDNACKLYNSLVTASATGQHEIDSWPADLPWLYYTAGEKPQYVLSLHAHTHICITIHPPRFPPTLYLVAEIRGGKVSSAADN